MNVLITGGGTGLGRGIAQALVNHGANVTIVGRRAEVLEQTAGEIGARALPWDITQPGLIEAAGPLDHLVNNAGLCRLATHSRWTAQDFRDHYELAVVAPAMLGQAFAAQARKGSSILNISSTLAERVDRGLGAYSAAKAGMLSLTRSQALELAHKGIRANAILPGAVPTDMTMAPRGDMSLDQQMDELRKLHPIGRLGEPGDIGQAALWLLTAPWVTGACVPVDGGLLLL